MLVTKLKGFKVAILVADGFEKLELTLPMKALKIAGAKIDIISLHKGKIRGMNLHKPASKIKVDKVLSEVSVAEYDCLFIPGGFINPDLLRQSSEARNFVKGFHEQNKPIASLCHGPWLLASAGILTGRKMTSWPGIRDDMVNAGAIWVNQSSVTDKNLITSRGPQDIAAFIPAMIGLFSGTEDERSQYEAVESDAQATEPSSIVQQTVSLVPNLPFKWIAGAAVVALGAYAVSTDKRAS